MSPEQNLNSGLRALGDFADELRERESSSHRDHVRARKGIRSSEQLHALRLLKRGVNAKAGSTYRHQLRVYRLVVELLGMWADEQPRYLFDALILLPPAAVEAVELQHRIARERSHSLREQQLQYCVQRDGYSWREGSA